MNVRLNRVTGRTSSRLTGRTPAEPTSRPPALRGAADDGQHDSEDAHASMLVEYARVLLRRKWLVGSLAAAGLLAGVLLHLTTQPVYRTRTSIDITSINGEFMNMHSVDPTVAASSGESMIQTQIKLLQSDSLLERVQERLTDEPHPLTVPRMDLLSRLQQTLHIGHPAAIGFNALLNETSGNFKVKPLGITRLVEITCDSWDPVFAARFCNVLTNEFQSEDLESRGADAKRTSDWLMHQAADIRQKAEDSEQNLIAATGGNGLMLSQETGNSVGEDRLRQMQGELVKAQADRMEKEAENSIARTASPDAVPSVVSSPAYAAARTKLADLRAQVAALVPPLTEANPKVMHLRAEIKEVQDNMTREQGSSSERLQNEFAAAKHREDLLTLAYRTQESSVSSDMEKGSKVALLRREVESEQQLYATLLQRAKEAGFASAMQASTIRTVDAARRPRLAVFPQRITTDIVGALLGLMAGLGIAFFKERSNVVLRLPGESERLLHVAELGVIPSPRLLRNTSYGARSSGALTVLRSRDKVEAAEHAALESAGWSQQFSIVAEAYRGATLSILLSNRTRSTRVYIVSSPSAGEGKTTVTTNLGVAISKSKVRVALIDGDLRKPSLHRAFSIANELGLRDVLRGEVSLSAVSTSEYCKATAFPNLSLVPAGSGDEEVVELLHSPRFRDLLDRLSRDFDLILVDTPPMLHMADARIFAGQADGAILIFRAGVTTRDEASAARDLLDRDRVHVVGSILNDFNPRREGQYGYYQSYYAYQEQSTKESRKAVGL